jgi:hypothetical protein
MHLFLSLDGEEWRQREKKNPIFAKLLMPSFTFSFPESPPSSWDI